MPATLDNARQMKSPVLYVVGDQEPEDPISGPRICGELHCAMRCAGRRTAITSDRGLERETAALVVDGLRRS